MPVKFPCGDITLEGEWHFPGGEDPVPAVVVCHPYPPAGGTMHNNVVVAICEALFEKSIAAFRFNFRGVEGSEGSFGEGVAEREDVKAAIDFVFSSPRVDKKRIGLAGYSFGAMMALAAGRKDERVSMLALASAPLSDVNWGQLKEYGKPKFYIIGDADQMLPFEKFRQGAESALEPEEYSVISGADHYMGGYEKELARWMAEFFDAGYNS
ncbi:alpha/beta hydrolase [Chloroflexota bacterium]